MAHARGHITLVGMASNKSLGEADQQRGTQKTQELTWMRQEQIAERKHAKPMYNIYRTIQCTWKNDLFQEKQGFKNYPCSASSRNSLVRDCKK